jgi:succinylglutamate desuccinylase
MISLDIRNDPTYPRIAVVGCLHGNELIGRELFLEIAKKPEVFKNIIVIIANTDAYAADKRCIEQDLNRSFPGDPAGNTEERLAAEILPLVADADFVVDLHTTTSPNFGVAAIVGPLVERNQRVIQAFQVDQVAIMEASLLSASLIGNTNDGVSIEYGLKEAGEKETIQAIVLSLKALQFKEDMAKLTVQTYDVQGTVPLETKTEAPLKNFVYSKELGGYPFIIDEKHYTTMRGFLLVNKRSQDLDF